MENRLKISNKEIALVLQKNFNIEVKHIKRLVGFYDSNFYIKSKDRSYFFKIYGVDKKQDIIFQTAYAELLRNNGLPVPETFTNHFGFKIFKFKNFFCVIQEWLPGKHLSEYKLTNKIAFKLGETLGRMHNVSYKKKLPGNSDKKYIWDLAQFNFVDRIFNKNKKSFPGYTNLLIKEVILDWKSSLKKLNHLRVGYIQNDFHDRNILYQRNKLTGILDFGDALKSWHIADLSVPIVQVFFGRKNYLNLIKSFLDGYKNYFSLTEKELGLLDLIIRMRAVLLIIGIPLVFNFKENNIEVMYKDFINKAESVLVFFSNTKNTKKFNKLIKS